MKANFRHLLLIAVSLLASFNLQAGESAHKVMVYIKEDTIRENQPFKLYFELTVSGINPYDSIFKNSKVWHQPTFRNFHLISPLQQTSTRSNMNMSRGADSAMVIRSSTIYEYSCVLVAKSAGETFVEPIMANTARGVFSSDTFFLNIISGKISKKDSITRIQKLRPKFDQFSYLPFDSAGSLFTGKDINKLFAALMKDTAGKYYSVSINQKSCEYHVKAREKFSISYSLSTYEIFDMDLIFDKKISTAKFVCPSGINKMSENTSNFSNMTSKDGIIQTKRANVVLTASSPGTYIIPAFKLLVEKKKFKMPQVVIVAE